MIKVDIVRLFQDGNFVIAHCDDIVIFFGARVGFEVFRFEKGLVVEHWDNLQLKPAGPNPSNRTVLDGFAGGIQDLEKTRFNKALVARYMQSVWINGKFDKIGLFLNGEDFIQHTASATDGVSGTLKALQDLAAAKITLKYKYERVHKILGQGNFVLTISEGQFAGQPTSMYDLFRLAGGKIVEHWDV